MALPNISALEDCADFSKAVQPFIPQLYALPAKFLDVIWSREGLLNLYRETNPLISGFAVSLVLGAVFLVVAEINRNYSQVDRCWSLLPTLYIAHFDAWARLTGVPAQRIDLALLFSTIWSVSMTGILGQGNRTVLTVHPSTDTPYFQLLEERGLQRGP
jgi:steroid 5-alpha reductase family enzyme